MIRYIIGLGNPGKEYHNTPHNLGRVLVEQAGKAKELSWKKEKEFYWTDSKPSFVYLNSYMNNSGTAVLTLLKKFNCPANEILVCTDDFDIPLGSIRLRKKGSAGSHNGLKSILEHLQNQDFPRLRLGIGPLPEYSDPVSFVLKPFTKENKTLVEQTLEKALSAIESIISDGIDKAMNRFNGDKLTVK